MVGEHKVPNFIKKIFNIYVTTINAENGISEPSSVLSRC